nr:nucleoside diphosphate kinase, mitochondrial-like [Pelodiscus sinensis]|eukprot:XP_014424868.1 nucleoside diphosphate kinase, mitochondrial-like [Pelodiscus sinensis]
MKLLQANEGILAEHYHELRRKPFYPALIHYMTSGPVVAMVWEGYNVVRTSRAMVGDTDSAEAKPGTIRGDFSIHVSRNTPCQRLCGDGPAGDQSVVSQQRAGGLGLLRLQQHLPALRASPGHQAWP